MLEVTGTHSLGPHRESAGLEVETSDHLAEKYRNTCALILFRMFNVLLDVLYDVVCSNIFVDLPAVSIFIPFAPFVSCGWFGSLRLAKMLLNSCVCFFSWGCLKALYIVGLILYK